MLIAAGYVIFLTGHMITDKRYFIITAAAFVLACAVFAVLIFRGKMKDKKSLKTLIALCIAIVVFQVLALPAANIFSQTLPAWKPRGTIYQFPRFSNSVSQNEVGLMMRYYLNGKTLYANHDYPLEDSHNGELFITGEYEFAETDYPVLSNEQAQEFYDTYNKTLQTITVQENPKLNIPSFKIAVSNTDSEELVLLTDEQNNWYFMTPSLYEEAFGE